MWYAKGSSVLPASGGALRPSMPSPISSAPWMAYRPTSLPARRSICETWVMAKNVLVDAGFVVALLSSRDNHHEWAVTQASELPPPWSTCEAVLSESFHLLGGLGAPLYNGVGVVKRHEWFCEPGAESRAVRRC